MGQQFICTQCDEKMNDSDITAHKAHHEEMTQKRHSFDPRSDPNDRYDNEWCAECGNAPDNALHNETFIEYPSVGRTYHNDMYGVYEYGVFPNTSVLHGQQRRTFITCFDTLEQAQAAHPEAIWDGGGSNYQEVNIPVNPPRWFDPADAGESWDEDY